MLMAIGCSCRVDLLCRPAELAAVAQHAMENDRELAGHGDGGFPGVDSPRQARPPGIQRRSARNAMEDDPGRLTPCGNADDFGPGTKSLGPGGSILIGGDVIAAEIEQIVEPVRVGEEALCLTG